MSPQSDDGLRRTQFGECYSLPDMPDKDRSKGIFWPFSTEMPSRLHAQVLAAHREKIACNAQ